MPDTQETRAQAVVVNLEEQYSIWPADTEPPAGWRREGFTGTEDECLAYIDEVWTDMRPLSLRRWMSEREQPAAG
jgi:MbtH protein